MQYDAQQGAQAGGYYPDQGAYGQDQAAYGQDQAWFSDPNVSNYGGYQQSSFVPAGPVVAPGAMPMARPGVTSVGFDLPPPSENTLGGSLGGMGGKAGYGANHSRLGLSTYEGEPPLLVELGVDFSAIAQKTRSALHPMQAIDHSLMADGDLAGPLVFCLSLGFFLMLTGKLHFGYIFGFGVVGCVAMYSVLNLMTQRANGIELHVVFSVLGYSLLPIVFLAAVAVLLPLKSIIGWVLVPPSVAWCTVTSTRFFEATLSAREQRYLIAYPAFLFFACFALITVF
jgi:hypothetical protein